MASTTISVEGDLTYRDSLSFMARLRRTTVAKLTRAALDSIYGDELQEIEAHFREKGGTRKRQRANGQREVERAK